MGGVNRKAKRVGNITNNFMATFRVSISKKRPANGVYDYAQTVVTATQQAAIQQAYNAWQDASKPALNACDVLVTVK